MGGSAAAASAGGLTSFLATSLGTAALASGIGAAGGGFAGSRYAHLIGVLHRLHKAVNQRVGIEMQRTSS